jgi:hypothetical protein
MAPKAQVYFHHTTSLAFNGTINLGGQVLKLALTNTAPAATFTQLSQITQIAAGGGYTTGGFTLTVSSSTQASGLYRCIIDDLTFTPGGAVAAWRWGVVYNDTVANDPPLWYYDYGSTVTLATGVPFLFDFDGTLGAVRVPYPA